MSENKCGQSNCISEIENVFSFRIPDAGTSFLADGIVSLRYTKKESGFAKTPANPEDARNRSRPQDKGVCDHESWNKCHGVG
ncbi:MAG: hypothetical protein GQ567_02350 [Methanosarcinales archaeon]|nr:hypothetical protein [Methanosarcinales archaeon]